MDDRNTLASQNGQSLSESIIICVVHSMIQFKNGNYV